MALVSALVQFHKYLNTKGPTDEWDLLRSWLFDYVDMYKLQLAIEDKSPKLAMTLRTDYIKARVPFAENERRSVGEAVALKKQIRMQVKPLKAKDIWW